MDKRKGVIVRVEDKWLNLCENSIQSSLRKFFSNESSSVDIYLDARDSTPFDENWVEAFEEIERNKKSLTKKERKIVEDTSKNIREKIFKAAIAFSGESDFSAAISDDAGIIIESMMMEINNEWINGLISEYLKLELPKGQLDLLDSNPFLK